MYSAKDRRQIPDLSGVTFNVHHGTTEAELIDDLERIIRQLGGKPSFMLLQEVKPPRGHTRVFRSFGYQVDYLSPEFAVAYLPERLEHLHTIEWEGDHSYWADPKALTVRAYDKAAGVELDLTTVHPPAHVQRKDHGRWPNIWKALAETDRMWDTRAREAAREGVGSISGGDENVDLERGWFPRFFNRLIRGAARVVDPPKPTHHRRRIDRFRINRLLKVVRGSKRVITGLTSDHHAFACTFRYRMRRIRRARARAAEGR